MTANRTNRDIERHYFEQFRGAYSLPTGEVSYFDRPDVLVRGDLKVGIEVTNFYLRDGRDPTSEQRQRVLAAVRYGKGAPALSRQDQQGHRAYS